MVVLSVIGWVFLGLLVLVAILLLLPVIVTADYRAGVFSLKVRVLFFVNLKILPAKPKKKGKEKKKKHDGDTAEEEQEEREEKKKKAPKERSIEEWIDLVKRLASSASRALRFILKGLLIYDVEIVLPVQAQQASDVAVRVGQLHAAIGGARAVLENLLHIRYRRYVLIPDFTGESKKQLVLACKVVTAPVIIVVAGILALIHFIRHSHLIRRFMRLRALKKRRKKMAKQRKALAQTSK
ncbi:hypothetical protein LJC49_08570 [Ruminococcaceae bacterium OttesenSCG-928-I18]|nr:hypothetical protein [Ruminococcaceae bacterium OttesenSCG-928-I18]